MSSGVKADNITAFLQYDDYLTMRIRLQACLKFWLRDSLGIWSKAARFCLPFFCTLFLFSACGKNAPTTPLAPADTAKTTPPSAPAGHYETIEWTDLMPKDDLEALMNPPEYLDEIADGSAADTLDGQFRTQRKNPDDPYQKALVSTRVIPEFHQRKIRLPGFIVPLDFADHQVITTFLLVPFFGACIHLPPPPPNQIIFAIYEPGLPVTDLSDAFFVEGTLHVELKEHDLATSAYSMTIDRILPYEE